MINDTLVGQNAARLPADKTNAGSVIVPDGRQTTLVRFLAKPILSLRHVLWSFSGEDWVTGKAYGAAGLLPGNEDNAPDTQDAHKTVVPFVRRVY